jgi:hypothetical protein
MVALSNMTKFLSYGAIYGKRRLSPRGGDDLLNVNTALVNASSRQIDARSNDALGVFLIGLPLASMTGKDATAQVAMLKGSADAIRRAGDAKSCGSLAPVITFDEKPKVGQNDAKKRHLSDIAPN